MEVQTMEFKHFFNAYDTQGTQHTGLLQSMDFSALSESVTFLNELTMAFVDADLYNEFSNSIVMRQWGYYMEYSKEHDRFEIFAQFYTDFVNALAAKLMRAEKWYQLSKIDFKSLSATDIKTITHGLKETVRNYGEDETTNVYGQKQDTSLYGAQEITERFGDFEESTIFGEDEKETVHGQKHSQIEHGAQTKTTGHGKQEITKDYDKVVVTVSKNNDSHVIGATTTETDNITTNQLYPLGASAYVDDTKQILDGEVRTAQQTNTDTWGDQETETDARQDNETQKEYTDTETHTAYMDTTLDNSYTDSQTRGEHTDIHAIDQHTDVTEHATHTDTFTSGTHTDTKTREERIDTEQIKAYTDTENHVKHIIISPEKYYAIQKELTEIGVYNLIRDAVRETMLLCVWEGGYIW